MPPFFSCLQPETGVQPPLAGRYPYHDNDQCPDGQAVKQAGQWQYYEPTTVAETRARCPRCVELDPTHRRTA
ncbi:hypothetical protein ACFST9_14715 [Hymenobacter monticola]|uniref:Zinc-ribbon domain-containing protein n=1 Tax=Hymenobacter monticola TaxID=1705399 RepID=A0ABY4BBV3_9BACT|nr:hypothetical protein [Hymenobacter monticola]UOE36634.1 hypothetical protein MTP16_24980 [Hymenobacter monticola]